jgi:hypothetical protein
MIISVHNTKGGVGTATLLPHLAHLATEAGHKVYRTTDSVRLPETIDSDLILIDGIRDDLPACVLVIPITCRMAEEHAHELADNFRGPVIYLPNMGHRIKSVPPHLPVTVAQTIPYSHAIAYAADQARLVWDAPDRRTSRSPGAIALRSALLDVLRLANAEPGDEDTSEPMNEDLLLAGLSESVHAAMAQHEDEETPEDETAPSEQGIVNGIGQ